MTTIHIEINGEKVEARQGQMLIEAMDEAKIDVPRFCYHKKLSIAANCRMCLVEIANSAKPLPACATPVSEGMKVLTTSQKAIEAQRAVMEFLLINHPLDCPICDQGGQCELQDVALEYGRDSSRYSEGKRAVKDLDLGPLISTEMTRCIHCTRCVRFGAEVAGVREMGATGRGEFLEIGTYIERSVDSELSGNIIDLCPVGALTSKPFRFKARAWELNAFSGLSMHDCVGSHLYYHALNNKVMRTLPRENESLNEVWLSDRDRFSYEALNHPQRLQQPQIKREGKWETVDWATALFFAVEKLKEAMGPEGADQLGALISPNATMEEAYLFQKLFRSLGCQNIDHRLRSIDHSHQTFLGAYPHVGITLPDLEHQETIVLIGSDIHKEQPLIGHRVRKATLNGAQIVAIVPCQMNYHFTHRSVVSEQGDLVQSLLEILKAIIEQRPAASTQLSAQWLDVLKSVTPSEAATTAATVLLGKSKISVLLGQYAIMHPHAGTIYVLSRLLALIVDATWGEMSLGANAAGVWLAGAVPHRLPLGQPNEAPAGLTAYQMWQHPRRAYVLMNIEPEYDSLVPHLAKTALKQASIVVVLSTYDNPHYREYANVLLPTTPPTEMSGTYVNAFGEWHNFQAAVQPLGESRPAWKILRVLANLWEVKGFDYGSLGEVLGEILKLRQTKPHHADNLLSMPFHFPKKITKAEHQWIRLAPVPLYAVDGIVRRAPALQETRDAQCDIVKIHPNETIRGWEEGQLVWVVQEGIRSTQPLPIVFSECIPPGVAWIPSSLESTRSLGEPFGVIELIRLED